MVKEPTSDCAEAEIEISATAIKLKIFFMMIGSKLFPTLKKIFGFLLYWLQKYVIIFKLTKFWAKNSQNLCIFCQKENPKSTNSQSFHFKNEHLLLIVYPTPINRLNTCSLVFCLKRERRLRSVASLVFVIIEAVALLHPTKISKA